MEEPKGDRATTINLSEGVEWITFQIGDHSFDCEVFEAADVLSENDRRHVNDLDSCTACDHVFLIPREERSIEDKGKWKCPQCDSDRVLPSQLYLDDVAKILVGRYGAKRCSRKEAAAFYSNVIKFVNAKKKELIQQQASPSGLTGSIPETGTSQSVEAG